jgi:NADH dehydrogenase
MHIGVSNAQETSPHVVILGGGFGGLQAARTLSERPVRVTLVDRENHHLFQPLLYQVATAALSPGDIAKPLRSILRGQSNVRVLLGEATAIDVTNRTVSLADGHLTYDYLIVATGARHSYFNHPEWESLAPGLKALDDAIEIRHRVLRAFEAAERAPTSDSQRDLLTFVVIGGGPTGVEMAGAIAELARYSLAREFRQIDPMGTRVILLEGGPRILPTFPPGLSASAERALRRLGVEVRTGTLVTAITPEAVHIGEEIIPSRTIVWAAGNSASPLGRTLDAQLDRSGRVLVKSDLTVPGHPDVYVIGDLAAFVDQHGATLPGVAPVAIQQGRAAAENVWRTIRGRERRRFSYRDRGNLATVGRGTGLADLGPLQLSGAAAWIAWLGVHLFWLIGFDNRLLVLFKWAWSYLTHERGARLIIREWRRRTPARTADDGARPPASVQRGTGGSNDRGRDGGLESHRLQPSDAASGVGSSYLVRGAPGEEEWPTGERTRDPGATRLLKSCRISTRPGL